MILNFYLKWVSRRFVPRDRKDNEYAKTHLSIFKPSSTKTLLLCCLHFFAHLGYPEISFTHSCLDKQFEDIGQLNELNGTAVIIQ